MIGAARQVSETRLEVLDHGYIEVVETWGSDERIIEAARMSTAKGFLGWGGRGHPCPECQKAGRLSERDGLFKSYEECEAARACATCKGAGTKPGDEKLLKFLWDNKHATPFEMAGMIVEVQAPIFVFREWHRHRTQSYNELSARYTPLPDVNYVPSVERLMLGSDGKNKQAGTIKGAKALTIVMAHAFRESLVESYADAQRLYEVALEAGVPKELARVHLPVGRYSRMRASANLRNWLAFMTLRQAPGAQWEIRQYADSLAALIGRAFPRTYAVYVEGGG